MFHPDQERREQFQNVTLPDNVCCSDLNFSLRCYLDYTPTYYYNVYATVVVPFPFSFSVSFPYTNHFFNHICFCLTKDPPGSVILDASVSVCHLAKEAVVPQGLLTTVQPCSPSWWTTKLPSPRHLLPHQRAPPDVRPPVILTVIPDVASRQISQCSLNMLTLTMLDIPAILPEIPVLLWVALPLVPPNASQVNVNEYSFLCYNFQFLLFLLMWLSINYSSKPEIWHKYRTAKELIAMLINFWNNASS